MPIYFDRDRKRKTHDLMKNKRYIRDKRSPTPSSPITSKVMSSIRAKNTKPELAIRKRLWSIGIRGYRIHYDIQGRPDIAFVNRRLAVFIHGCFWHRCPNCKLPAPRSNQLFWAEKFTKNMERDAQKISELEKIGWKVLVFWECEIKSDPLQAINRIKGLISYSQC